MWAWVTTRRSIRSNPLPQAASAASSAAVPSGPGSPSGSVAAATPQSTSVSRPSPPASRYALTVSTPWMPSGSAIRCSPGATSVTMSDTGATITFNGPATQARRRHASTLATARSSSGVAVPKPKNSR